MKETIIFDIDDTSGDLKTHLQNLYRRVTGDESISFNDWVDFNAQDRYGISSQRLGELFIEDQSLEKMKPHDGLIEVTAILKSMDYNIEFVTARGWHPDAFEITRKWLDDHYVSYDRINIVPLFQCKEEATRHIERIKLFVDDRDDHCTNMIHSGRVEKCLLFEQPWNKLYRSDNSIRHPEVSSIKSLYEVLEYLK